MVFSDPKVAAKVRDSFVPVALKAGLVNNPPPGIEGKLYREIGRSKAAPQGICVANSAGQVLAWTLSFDDEPSIMKFLDYALERFAEYPDGTEPVITERYLRFPGHKMPDVRDTHARFPIRIRTRRREPVRGIFATKRAPCWARSMDALSTSRELP